MKKRRISLSVKLNILIVAIILAVSSLLLFNRDRTYWETIYEPYIHRLQNMDLPVAKIEPLLKQLMPPLGTEELNKARSGDELTFLQYLAGVTDEAPYNNSYDPTILGSVIDLSYELDGVINDTELDEIFVEAQKGESVYAIVADYRRESFELAADRYTDNYGLEASRFPGLVHGEYAAPVLIDDAGAAKLVRCFQIDTEWGTCFVWAAYNMNEFFIQHNDFLRRSILFVAGMTVLAVAVGTLMLRRLVTRRVRNLAKAARDFVPGEDGKYVMDSVSRVETGTADEIGDLGREICSMQERIVRNTESLTQMTAEKERISTELDLAREIQASALPKKFPAFPERTEFDLYASMKPAREVGGDFYDFFLVDEDHLALVIADVSGKGVPAALFMMVSKSLIKDQLMTGCDPAQAMERAGRRLCEGNESQMFVTVWLAVLELSTGRGIACNAGHEHPVVRRAGGNFEILEYKHDWLAGIFENAEYHPREFRMNPGDCLFVYTDGVPEASREDRTMFREERLVSALNEDPAASPEKLVRRVQEAVDRFAGSSPQFDDMTMLCLKYYGPGKPETESGKEHPEA